MLIKRKIPKINWQQCNMYHIASTIRVYIEIRIIIQRMCTQNVLKFDVHISIYQDVNING